MMMCLLGLLRTERFAREMSAVTRVMEILGDGAKRVRGQVGWNAPPIPHDPGLPSIPLSKRPKTVIQATCPSPAAGDCHGGAGGGAASSPGLTCHQTDASRSQIKLSASCL